jgi:ferric-dicitrate binding protein FerR (iron transport regulator)
MDLFKEHRISELAEKLKNKSLSEYEYNELQQWIIEGYKNPQLAHLMDIHWQKLHQAETEVDDKKINEIYNRILLKLTRETKNTSDKNRSISWFNIFQKVAAILIIPVIIASVYYNFYNSKKDFGQSWVEINSPEGTRTKFGLPDGSTGWLNGGSTLKYNPMFADARNVELNGEAYFDIAKQNGSSFIVSTAGLNIKVLGTKFNVFTNPNDGHTEVVLEEGKVEAVGTTKSFNREMNVGDKLDFNFKSNSVKIENIDTESYTAWKDGFLMLNEETLEQGARRIERWYNVEIEIVDDVLKNYGFKATFKDESLKEVIRLLAITTPIDYEILPRKMDENGVYLKQKIILKLKQ